MKNILFFCSMILSGPPVFAGYVDSAMEVVAAATRNNEDPRDARIFAGLYRVLQGSVMTGPVANHEFDWCIQNPKMLAYYHWAPPYYLYVCKRTIELGYWAVVQAVVHEAAHKMGYAACWSLELKQLVGYRSLGLPRGIGHVRVRRPAGKAAGCR